MNAPVRESCEAPVVVATIPGRDCLMRRRRSHLALLAVAVGFFAAPSLRAAPADYGLSELSLEELMQIEVTLATRRPQKVSRSAAAVSVVTRDELLRAGVRTLPDALRLVPGLQVARIDGGKWIVTARGFAGLFANKLLVLIDGRSVYTPLFSGVFWESQDVQIEDIDRVEVIRGPGGTLWGANAVNGIINIVTRHAAESAGTLLEAGGGGERRFASLRQGFAVGTGNVRVYANYFDRARSAATTAAPVRDDVHMARTGLRADFDRASGDRLTLIANAFRGSVGENLTYVAQPQPPWAQRHYFDAEVAGADVLARGSRRWSEDSETELQLYYDVYHRDQRILEGQLHNADLTLQHQFRLGTHRLVAGAGYRRTWDETSGSFAAWFEPDSRTTHLFTGFLHEEVDLVPDRLRVSVGAKVERNSFTGLEWQPNARLWYSPRPQHDLWLAVSRPLRTPSRGDDDLHAILTSLPADSLFDGAPPTLVRVDNSRSFETERMLAVDAGYRVGLSPAWFADLSVFHNRYANLLTQEPGLPVAVAAATPYLILPLRTQNLADAWSAGAELVLDWQASATWQLRGVYSYLYLDVNLDGDSRDTVTESYEDGSPRHQASLRCLADLWPWSLSATGRWVDDLARLGIDAYATADARLARSLGDGLEVSLTGRNLLQADHQEAISSTIGAAPAAVEREVYLTLTWRR